MAFKTGDSVAVRDSSLVGEVKGAAVDSDANFLLLVAYEDLDGVAQERYFLVEDLVAG